MSNFEVELDRLITIWLKRGDDPKSMSETLRAAIELLKTMPLSHEAHSR